tara:strand:- start:769 stop:1020 length:252 start_codon:yes stop_codon:yes gene_type:complete
MNIKDNLPTLFIALVVTFAFLLVANHAKAENNAITNWFIQEKEAIVEYQKDSWSQSKDQFVRNKEQIQDMFYKVSSFFSSKIN